MNRAQPQAALRAVVVDDEVPARLRLRSLLEVVGGVDVVAEAGSVDAALRAVEGETLDAAFLDIEMPRANGFQFLERLDPTHRPLVVFVTAHEEYARRAFEVDAADYLLKPLTVERVRAAVGRMRRAFVHRSGPAALPAAELLGAPTRADRLPIWRNGRVLFLETDSIDWVDAAHTSVHLYAGKTVHSLRRSITSVEALLDPTRFLRIHRCSIVNLKRVKELLIQADGRYWVVLEEGQKLPVGRSYRDRVRLALGLGS
jgi:two-component system LytT family response regulator